MGKNDEYGLFLNAEEAAEIKEIVAEVKQARAERKAKEADGGWTKEKIMAVKDIVKRQRLIKEHMGLFRK